MSPGGYQYGTWHLFQESHSVWQMMRGESLRQMQRGQCYRGWGMGASSAKGEEPTFSAEISPRESEGSGRVLSHLHPRAESSSLPTRALTITADPLGSCIDFSNSANLTMGALA